MSAGELRLQSADPEIQPLLAYHYLEDEFDRKRMREMVRTAVKLADYDAFKPIIEARIELTDAELASDDVLDDYLLREVTTGQHISGTCKMGPATDPMASVHCHKALYLAPLSRLNPSHRMFDDPSRQRRGRGMFCCTLSSKLAPPYVRQHVDLCIASRAQAGRDYFFFG